MSSSVPQKSMDGFCISMGNSFTKLISVMKSRFYLLGLAILLSLSTVSVKAANTENKEALSAKIATMTTSQKEERAKVIKLRVEEIKSMDMSVLSRAERKQLKSELRAMKYEANELGSGGIYLSLAAIIIIILLLILIL
jgi:hypothetical protein